MRLCSAACRVKIDELTLKAGSPSQIKIMLGECWFITTSNMRLKGNFATDREHNTLSVMSGGRSMVLYGGISRR